METYEETKRKSDKEKDRLKKGDKEKRKRKEKHIDTIEEKSERKETKDKYR
jgi:hypothetical protein